MRCIWLSVFASFLGHYAFTLKGEAFEVPASTVVKSAFVLPVEDGVIHNSFYSAEFLVAIPNVSIPDSPRECKARPFLCKLVRHTHSIQLLLADEIYSANPYLNEDTYNTTTIDRFSRGLLNFMGKIEGFLWGMATEGDIDELHTDIGTLAQKFNQFSSDSNRYMKDLSTNLTAYSKNLSGLVEQGFLRVETEINKTAVELNQVEVAIADITNNLVLSQHLQSVVDLMNEVASDCRNQLIPRSILSDQLLKQKLSDISRIVSEHNYTIAVSINQILTLRVAKCVFSSEFIKIYINIPIKRRNLEMKMYRLIHAPYSFNDEECVLANAPTYIAQVNNSMIPITAELLRLCPMQNNMLCLIPEGIYEPTQFSKCATALAGSKQIEILKNCVFQCQRATRVRVQAVSTTQFIVSNAKNFTIQCLGKQEINYFLRNSVGAVILNLACGCSATIFDHFIRESHVINPSWPCARNHSSDEKVIFQVVPLQMSSLKSAIFEQSSDLFVNSSEIINKAWKISVPTLSVEPPSLLQFSSAFISEQLAHQVDYTSTLLYIWLSVLTVIVIGLGALIIMKNQSSSSHNGRGAFNLVPFMVLFYPGGVFGSSDIDTNVTFKDYMWKILQTLEIINVVTNAFIAIFVLSILVILWKGLRNLKLVNRMVRAWDNGDDIVLNKAY